MRACVRACVRVRAACMLCGVVCVCLYEFGLGGEGIYVVRTAETASAAAFGMRLTPSGKWKIPSEFSGTITNNWITRAIDIASDSIDSILSSTLKDIV